MSMDSASHEKTAHVSVGVFIKTWASDLQWLEYSLRLIEKNLSGHSGVWVVADENCRGRLPQFQYSGVSYCKMPYNGYMAQQAEKLMADLVVPSDVILFVDSDVMFMRPVDVSWFLHQSRPLLIRESYDRLGKDSGEYAWKAITESYFGSRVEYEYMRRMPLAFCRETLAESRNRYPWLINSLKAKRDDRRFSEFNLLGALADAIHPEKYRVLTVGVDDIPEPVCKQFWSWSGLTPEIRQTIEEWLQ